MFQLSRKCCYDQPVCLSSVQKSPKTSVGCEPTECPFPLFGCQGKGGAGGRELNRDGGWWNLLRYGISSHFLNLCI